MAPTHGGMAVAVLGTTVSSRWRPMRMWLDTHANAQRLTAATGRALILALTLLGLAPAAGWADEAAIRADMAAFFKTAESDTAERQEIVARILADPAYDRAKVHGWLHQADLFQPLPPGRREIQVKLSDGTERRVVLRIPKAYDPHRPWPMIYALHGLNGHGDDIMHYVERLLGDEVEDFVVAAPDRYEEAAVHDPKWPPVGEHPAVLLALKQTVHVDSDRVYVMGYSRGGHTTWTLAVLYADQFAGAMSLAGTFVITASEKLWDAFLPNVAQVPLLCAWGAGDTKGPNGQASPDGGIAGVNRKLRKSAEAAGLHITAIEYPDKGHGDIVPPAEEVQKLLVQRRVQYPPKLKHTFRHLSQSSAYWVEGQRWYGSEWGEKAPSGELREGEDIHNPEDVANSIARAHREKLGFIEAEVDGQVIKINRRKAADITVWIGDGMIDWERPVVLDAGDSKKPEFKLEPDLGVCLAQAARTWDLDRLRWAGLRVRSGQKVEVVTLETEFPPTVGAKAPAAKGAGPKSPPAKRGKTKP